MVSNEEISVNKRNGRGKESLNIEKIHSMVGFATEGITGVSASHVEMNSGIQFFDGVSTADIQQILIKSANDLISLENPNYQYVAARLLLFQLRKQLFHRLWDHPKFIDHIFYPLIFLSKQILIIIPSFIIFFNIIHPFVFRILCK